MPLANDADLRAHLLRRAMLRPAVFLAAVLAEWPDEDLAAAIGADPLKVWHLRLCRHPTTEYWHEDVAQLATLVDGDASLLANVLAHAGVRRPC
jgi:hypothetical protein